MQEIVGIKEDYIAVMEENGITYGGNQGFFGEVSDALSRRKEQNGCGMVALTDIFLYLMSNPNSAAVMHAATSQNPAPAMPAISPNPAPVVPAISPNPAPVVPVANNNKVAKIMSADHTSARYSTKTFANRASYRECFDQMCKETGWHPGKYGMSSWMLVRRFNHMCRKSGIHLHARWGWKRTKIVERTRRMLEQDMPVILCIPMMVLPWQKKHQMNLYQYENGQMRVKTATQGHYVMITGIVEEKGEYYFRISSWGKMFYLPIEEYLKFVEEHFLGNILGNVMDIRRR